MARNELKENVLDDSNNPVNRPGGADDGKGELSPGESAAFDQIAANNRDLDRNGSDLPPPDSSQSPSNTWAAPDPRELEKNASLEDGQKSATSNAEKGFYNPFKRNQNGKKGRFAKLSRRQKIGAGFGAGGLVTLFLVLYPIIQGPLQLINFAQFLSGAHFINNEEFGNNRTSKLTLLYRYARGGSIQATRVGKIQADISDRMDTRLERQLGLRLGYDERTGIFRGFIVTDEAKAKAFLETIDDELIDTDASVGDNVKAGRKGDAVDGDFIAIKQDRNFKSRRSAVRMSVKALDINRISSAVGARSLSKLGGVNWSPITNLKRAAAENNVDKRAAKKDKDQDRRDKIKNGSDADNAVLRTAGDTPDDPDNPRAPPDSETRAAASEADEITKQAIDADTPDKRFNLTKLLSSRVVQAGAGATAVVGVLCAVKDVGNQAEELQYAQTIMPMMRMGIEFVSLGSQIQANRNLNNVDIGYYVDLLTDENGQNVVAAASIQAEKGQQPTGPDINPAVKPDAVNGKPALFELIDRVPSVGLACAISDGVGNFISGIPIVGNAVELAGQGVEAGINAVISPSGYTIEEFFSSVVSWLAGEAVNVLAEGPELGNIVNYGARLAANNQALAFGGRILSVAESLLLSQHNEAIKQEKIASKSIFQRYFDVYDGDSLTNIALSKPRQNPGEMFAGIFKTPQSLIATLSSPAMAQSDIVYDYGFDEVGFSLDEINNPDVQNPIELSQEVKPRLEELNEKFGKCFPINIDPLTERIELQSFTDSDIVNQFNLPDECKNMNTLGANSDGEVLAVSNDAKDFLMYRMYIADLVTAVSLECYELGITESCSEIGFSSRITPSVSTGPTADDSGPITISGEQAFPLAVTKSQIGTNIFRNGTTDIAGHPYTAYDIIADKGTTAVAITGGTIVRVSSMCGGNVSGITLNVPSQGISFWYGHIDPATVSVSEGQSVSAGTPLGKLVDHRVDCASGADHLHIDASRNIGSDIFRPACSRSFCPNQTRQRFVDFGQNLFNLFQALPD